MRRLILTCATALLLLALASCGGTKNTTSIPGPQFATDSTADASGSLVAQKEGFSLTVLDESFDYGGDAEFALSIRPKGPQTEVTVKAAADQLRCALLALSYPAGELHPVDGAPGAWPGLAEGELLSLTVLDDPGAVHFGAVVTRPQEHSGVSGDFAVLTVRFEAGAAEPRLAAAVPDLPVSMIPDLAVDFDTGDVTFSYVNVGDYNQNSLVEVADITPVGVNWDEESPDFPDPFPFDTIGSVVDGNNNGLIEVADITPIGQNWDKACLRWRLYGGDAADYPEDAADDNGVATLLGTIEFPVGLTLFNRLAVEETIDDAAGFVGEGMWLRPVGDQDDEGIPSNMYVPQPSDTDAPVWDFVPEGEGVIEVIPLDGGLRITWGSATDDSDFNYLGWVQDGGSIDYEAAPDITVPPSDPPDPTVDQVTEITGLTNGTEYTIAVRARDIYDNETGNDNPLTATPLAEAEVPATLTENPDFMGPMRISNGSAVDVSGEECIHFWSDLVIEDGGSLDGAEDGLCIVVHGDFTCDGAIGLTLPDDLPGDPEDAPSMHLVLMGDVTFGDSSVVTGNGNIFLVDDEEDLVDPGDVEDELDLPSDAEEFPWQLDYEEGGAGAGGKSAGAAKTTSRTVYYGPRPWTQWLVKGDWGKVPVQPRSVHRVVLRIWPVNGMLRFEDFSIQGPDGRPGADAHSCNAHGGDGQDNKWRFRIHCGRSLDFHNVNIKLGNGGRGGNATTPQDCDPGVAVGGDGGDALNKFRFTARSAINITGSFNFDPGHGGAGGTAQAWGKNGEDGCPAEDGADAFATGGNGGNVPRWGVSTRGAVNGTGNVNLGTAEGGAGGEATAWGGWGGNDTCCPGATGGSGGYAEGTGGDGGDSKFSDGGSGAAGGGATGGDGGTGHAAGGSGGAGASWYKIPGGDGGGGGDAVAVGGQEGEATGDGALTQGNRGGAEAIGGNGGDGGDGLPPGVGGAGGDADADGDPETELDGSDGLDGDQSPLFLSEHVVIIPDPFDPGPLHDNPLAPFIYTFPLIDALTDLEVGTLTLTFNVDPGGSFWIVEHLDGTKVLEMNGPSWIDVERSEVTYDNPTDDAPWIALDYTHYFTTGSVGVGFWYDGVPLDDYAVPQHLLLEERTDRFEVTPGLFYESFPISPDTPPQWDDCDITCDITASTQIIEIVIIDP